MQNLQTKLKLERVAEQSKTLSEPIYPAGESSKWKIPKKSTNDKQATATASKSPIVPSPDLKASAVQQPSIVYERNKPSRLVNAPPTDFELKPSRLVNAPTSEFELKPSRLVNTPSEFETPAKRAKLEHTESSPSTAQSMLSGLFSFAKTVVRSVATSLGTSETIAETAAPEIEPRRFQFQSNGKSTSSPSIFTFNGLTTNAVETESPEKFQSSTPANDRLYRLRQNLAANQKKEVPETQASPANILDDIMMTDDEDDTRNSDVTNDSDDGKKSIL